MSRSGWACSTLALLMIAAPMVRAEDPPAENPQAKQAKGSTFKPGEVEVVVTASLDPVETANTRLQAEEIQQFNRDTAASALELLPGVSVLHNTRNEDMIFVRGSDSRQVPLFVDGVPAYVPYDGSMDYGRFTTFDLSGIQVAKGFSSITYGANTLGGAINLVTRRPSERFEGDARAGVFDGGGRKVALNAGTNQGSWYLQAGGSYATADSWRMSSHFVPNAREDGGQRGNSDYTDKKASLKVGFTPNEQDEYVLGFMRQRADKKVVTKPTRQVQQSK